MLEKNGDLLIGFIGQGWVGKNYADNFESRGYKVIRYSLEKEYINNKEAIANCDIIFIALPTPTTPEGFDDSIVRQAISLVSPGKIAVIKSTLVPGSTESIQEDYKNIFVMHSPEFLAEATAAHDAANPSRNIIGIPINSNEYKEKAAQVLSVMPFSSVNKICSAKEAELIKYGANCFLYFKVIFANLLYDLSISLETDYETIKNLVGADPRIGLSHLCPINKSGRGAGGHCFIKDFEAFIGFYKEYVGDDISINALESIRNKNIDLLRKSNKDLDLLLGVYGE
ncbi:MAG: NAD(P)-binding domain-containing protein [Patescibacteria group bacterium]|jgi:nucleotide sugar dehydrogenase|nr:NAD(P)-binding domain-containing protein [Patescibacteria group bacterium]